MKFLSTLSIVTATALSGTSSCHSFSMDSPSKTKTPIITKQSATNTPILYPSSPNDKITFDIRSVANPVILPPPCNNNEWQCYYYGNNGYWNGGRPCSIPTGYNGLAISNDGISWTKVMGQEENGAILTPSEDKSGKWDEVQIGVGDVIRIDENELHMFYFGGSDEEMSFGPGMGSMVGFRLRIGRAKSFDNGRTWVKDENYVFDYDETEGAFASWPRIVTFDDDNDSSNKPWIMYYHSFNGKKFRVFSAESYDKGDTWTRTGLVLEGGESEDAFDYAGIGTRSVVKWRDGLLMVYEGVDNKGKHRLGAAFSQDGKDWTKLNEGKPILAPGEAPLGEWTKLVIGTPFVVNMPDGSLRIYHCARDSLDGEIGMRIGAVQSLSGDIEPECWTPLN
jgi:predicted GH43/DUF377 family glycosyl hydrolase